MAPSVAFKASAACPVKGIDSAETEVENPWSALYAKGDWIIVTIFILINYCKPLSAIIAELCFFAAYRGFGLSSVGFEFQVFLHKSLQ